MSTQSARLTFYAALVAIFALTTGCRSGGESFDGRYENHWQEFSTAQHQPANATTAAAPVIDQLTGPNPLEMYLQLGLMQNPEIQEMRFMVESLANRVPQAASLPDPMMEMMSGVSHVQTAAGAQDFALAMNQKIPWRGKLATSACIAEKDVDAARAELAAVELKVAEQIKQAYFMLYFNQQAIAIIENDKQQLELIESVVDRMYRVKREVTQQDVLQVQVALSQIDSELISYQQQIESLQARLARLLHVSPETKLEALDHLPPELVVRDIQRFYEMAIESRPELHAQLARIESDQKATDLARLNERPDVTLGFNWIATSSEGISPVANGDDAFMLTVGMNLPVYRKRIDAGVREAQTRTLADARKYDRLKDETMEGVADLFAKIKAQQETLALLRDDIIPKTKLTLDQSIDDYQVSKVDFLQMINNWRQLLRFHVAEKRLETELQQSLATLARQIGSFDLAVDGYTVQRAVAPTDEKLDAEDMDEADDKDKNENADE